MALDATSRARTLAQWMREMDDPCTGLTKPDLVAALAAIDDWIDTNQASFNTALPQPFRGSATTAMKMRLFAYVLWRRAGRLRAQEDG
jgi:hypothetical protein